MLKEFMTLETMATFGGLSLAVLIIVQFTKSIIKDKFGDSFVRLYTLVIALVLSFIFVNNGFNAQGIALTIINAVVITIASTGGYELIADPKALKSK